MVLGRAIDERKKDGAPVDLISLWREGLGALSDHELIEQKGEKQEHSATENFFSSVFLANVFHLPFSLLYFLCNSIVTCMVVGSELSHYGAERKPLRVTAPVGMQRSSFFLSLPYRFGVPLTICSATIHWLISQSVFFVRVINYDPDGSKDQDPANSSSRVGFSPIGIVIAFSLTTAMLIASIMIAFINQYPGGETAMPLMSTCSAAISAGCHPPKEDTDAHLLPVRWGVVSSNGDIGHCSFTTARDVETPVRGSLYA